MQINLRLRFCVEHVTALTARAGNHENFHTLGHVFRHGARTLTGFIIRVGVHGHQPQRFIGSVGHRISLPSMPSPFRRDQLSPEMQERYGFNRRPIGRYVTISTIALVFLAVLVFVTLMLGRDPVQYRLLTWEIKAADRVDLAFEVRAPADIDVTCVVRAQDSKRIDLGYAEVAVPAGEDYRLVEYSLRTLAPAYAAEVLTCAQSGEPLRVPGPQFPPGIAPPEQPWSSN